MDTVLATFIVIFLIIFAALSFSNAILSTQDSLGVAWRDMEARLVEYRQTSIMPVDAWLTDDESTVALVYQNNGALHLADFNNWDLIVQYYDNATPASYHIKWLPYTFSEPLSDGQWTVDSIYQDITTEVVETYEPDVLNPGEAIVLLARINPPVGPGETMRITLVTQTGSSASLSFTRNLPPELTTNQPLEMWSGVTDSVTTLQLEATDLDNMPEELVYTVTTAPLQGSLSAETFTQAEINEGAVTYTHTGEGDDSFIFTLSDGIDEISDLTFDITVSNAPPALVTNTGMALASPDTGVIATVALEVTDPNTPPEALIYTITDYPGRGMLSLSPTFTQADINNGALTYAHTDSGVDSFAFTVSDGDFTIGPYVFGITTP